jgi:hypothetical protein
METPKTTPTTLEETKEYRIQMLLRKKAELIQRINERTKRIMELDEELERRGIDVHDENSYDGINLK